MTATSSFRTARRAGATVACLRVWGCRWVLEVSSPGLERPLRWHRHWVRFVGREVQATVAGLGRVRARIVAVPDEATVVLQREGAEAQPIPLARIRDARLAVDW